MAQLNDLLVSGASRLLNGLGILGTTNADSIIPNTTETYELGSSSKKWKNAYIKTISANDMTLAILTVTNYATIGGGQAATAANTGALRVTGGLSATQNSFFSQNVTATKFIGPLEGNADSATVLKTARTINGTSFNGSANITTANWGTARNITITDSSQTNKGTAVSVNGSGNVTLLLPATIKATLSGNASSASVLGQDSRMDYGWNGLNYFNISGTAGNAAKANDTPTSAWWHILRFNHANSAGYYTDLAIPFNANSLYYKRIGNGSVQNSGWVKVLDALNYTDYTVTKAGSGASGTWSISISGNAATATALTNNAGSTGQPVYFTGGKPATIDWHIGNSGVGEHNANNVTYNFCGYYTSNGPATSLGASTSDGALYAQAYSSIWVAQIAQDYRNGGLYVRGKNNGTWQSWYTVLDTRNYTGILDSRYINASGDTMTGALNLANGTWNKAGDDAQFGDNNTAGSFAIQGLNGNTNLKMVTYGGSSYGTITWNGSSFVFSNTISGTLDGTASSAHYATRARHLESPDTRAVVINPSSLSATTGVQFDFKQASAIGLSSAGYSGVMSYRPYSSSSDWTGGPAHQIAYNQAGLYWRQSSNDTTWGAWRRIMTSANFSLSGTTLTITT